MKYVSVGIFKAQFSALLEGVVRGQPVGVCYGRRKKPVAILMPADQIGPMAQRKLGLWAKRMRVQFQDDFAISDEELLRS
jgi:antitoxin (DNA-binding transcriptional repressor) of toxin-antitoxin stability system